VLELCQAGLSVGTESGCTVRVSQLANILDAMILYSNEMLIIHKSNFGRV
jgi:hypothetical protein